METIVFYKGTALSPEVSIKDNGSVYITGNSKLKEPQLFYGPIIRQLSQMNVKNIDINFAFGDTNKENTSQIMNLLESVKANPWIESLKVLWVAAEEEMLEVGNEKINEILGKPFEYLAR